MKKLSEKWYQFSGSLQVILVPVSGACVIGIRHPFGLELLLATTRRGYPGEGNSTTSLPKTTGVLEVRR